MSLIILYSSTVPSTWLLAVLVVREKNIMQLPNLTAIQYALGRRLHEGLGMTGIIFYIRPLTWIIPVYVSGQCKKYCLVRNLSYNYTYSNKHWQEWTFLTIKISQCLYETA